MSLMKDALQQLQEGILLAVNKSIDNAKYDKTIRGRITKILNNNMYEVMINGSIYNIKSRLSHEVNDVVYILIPQNNYNDMFILSKV